MRSHGLRATLTISRSDAQCSNLPAPLLSFAKNDRVRRDTSSSQRAVAFPHATDACTNLRLRNCRNPVSSSGARTAESLGLARVKPPSTSSTWNASGLRVSVSITASSPRCSATTSRAHQPKVRALPKPISSETRRARARLTIADWMRRKCVSSGTLLLLSIAANLPSVKTSPSPTQKCARFGPIRG